MAQPHPGDKAGGESSCAASGSEEGQFAIVTGVQGPVSCGAPAQEVSGTLSRQDMSLSSLEEFLCTAGRRVLHSEIYHVSDSGWKDASYVKQLM